MTVRLHAALWIVFVLAQLALGGSSFDPWLRMARGTGGNAPTIVDWRGRPGDAFHGPLHGADTEGERLSSSASPATPAASADVANVLRSALESHAARVARNAARAKARLCHFGTLAIFWLPVILAGLVDGWAARRIRRCGVEPPPSIGRALGMHLLVALALLPVAWAATPAGLASRALAGWAVALSAALSFACSRVQGIGER